MRIFKDLYAIISYSLLIAQIGFISILLYNKFVYHRTLYYGDEKEQGPEEISAHYFHILKTLLYGTFILIIAWAIFTPLAILSNKHSTGEEDRIHMSKGVAGFIIAVILLVTDPFGILKWFNK